jgi:ribonuclease BN (tRNA processing enzyme)
MLVDFGSMRKIPQLLVDSVEDKIVGKNIDRCLLTHFHSDHYKGINELAKSANMQNRFSEILLPNLYFNKAAFKIQLFRLGSLSKGTAWEDAYNFVTSTVRFNDLLRADGVLHYVSKGAKFQIGRTDYTVLAPTLPDLKKLVDTELLSCAEGIIDEHGVDNSAAQLYHKIIEAASKIMQLDDILHNDIPMQRRVEKELSDDDIDKMLSDIERFSELKWDISYDKQKRLNGLQRKFSGDWNKLSIVFKADDDSLLMTGDMTKKAWRHTVKPYCRNAIKVFKVPHHGTKNYFCWDFPNDADYLISNGKCFDWHISALYPLHYSSANFSCTGNDGCEYRLGTGSHCSNAKNCGCPIGGNAIVVSY